MCSSVFGTVAQIPDTNNLKWGKMSFGSWFPSMVGQLPCFGSEEMQNIMAEGMAEEKCSDHGGEEVEGRGKKASGTRHSPQGHAPEDSHLQLGLTSCSFHHSPWCHQVINPWWGQSPRDSIISQSSISEHAALRTKLSKQENWGIFQIRTITICLIQYFSYIQCMNA